MPASIPLQNNHQLTNLKLIFSITTITLQLSFGVKLFRVIVTLCDLVSDGTKVMNEDVPFFYSSPSMKHLNNEVLSREEPLAHYSERAVLNGKTPL